MTCVTDPTCYAVMLMGGETGNFLSAVVLLTLWFLVSQFLAVIVYIANEMNLLEKLVDFIEKIQTKKLESSHISFLWYSHPYCDCSFSRYRLLLACRELSIIDFLLKAKFLYLQEVSFKQAHLIGLSSKCALIGYRIRNKNYLITFQYAHHHP